MSEQTFFTADLHFGHRGMIDRGYRKFADIDEMDEAIVAAWNAKVPEKNARVYLLGDISFRPARDTYPLLRRLNGKLHLIRGNHDRSCENVAVQTLFESISDIKEVWADRQKLMLCHYAMMTWNGMHHGSWMLHGHSHGSLPIDLGKPRMDVGIDCSSDYSPFSYSEVAAYMADKRVFVPVDYHGSKEST